MEDKNIITEETVLYYQEQKRENSYQIKTGYLQDS